MLRRFLILAVMLGAVPSTARAQSEADDAVAESESAVTFDSFQGPLAAYGEWVDVGSYGWAWRPFRVAAGWRPYLYGHWAWTDEGWLWVSDEPYGWATYHYGRWAFEPGWGWVWVPGHEWAMRGGSVSRLGDGKPFGAGAPLRVTASYRHKRRCHQVLPQFAAIDCTWPRGRCGRGTRS